LPKRKKKVASDPARYELHYQDETHVETNPYLAKQWHRIGTQQRIASVGVDPQPPFRRIYNPARQQRAAAHQPRNGPTVESAPEGIVTDEPRRGAVGAEVFAPLLGPAGAADKVDLGDDAARRVLREVVEPLRQVARVLGNAPRADQRDRRTAPPQPPSGLAPQSRPARRRTRRPLLESLRARSALSKSP